MTTSNISKKTSRRTNTLVVVGLFFYIASLFSHLSIQGFPQESLSDITPSVQRWLKKSQAPLHHAFVYGQGFKCAEDASASRSSKDANECESTCHCQSEEIYFALNPVRCLSQFKNSVSTPCFVSRYEPVPSRIFPSTPAEDDIPSFLLHLTTVVLLV